MQTYKNGKIKQNLDIQKQEMELEYNILYCIPVFSLILLYNS